MENNELVKFKGGLIKRVGNAIGITNKLLNINASDITPVNIGFETAEGLMSIIIAANTAIPIQKKEAFIISLNHQNCITVHLLQGFSKRAAENKSLMRFTICDIPKSLTKEFKIEVILEIDSNGILSVSMKDERFKIRVDEYSGGLSKEEIQTMKSVQMKN